jgi:histidinol-phosphate/aromatic aminotransferase/cobyric acid decarboxylase-like protein
VTIVVTEASASDADAIAALRHHVYAEELGQYDRNAQERLRDEHPCATVLCAKRDGQLVGYVMLTPPGAPLRIEHYVRREALPVAIGPHTAEARQLTVCPDARDSSVATRLLLACVSWLERQGASDVLTLGHDRIVPMYLRYGARRMGVRVRAGAIEYEILHTKIGSLREAVGGLGHLDQLLRREDGRCAHGGRALTVCGPRLEHVDALDRCVEADVLDAWFPPAPGVLDALTRHTERLARSSPPPSGEPLLAAIAEHWHVPRVNVVLGAGSSDLVYRAFTSWLDRRSRVLLVDPTYAEYAHVVERVVGAALVRCSARRSNDYRVPFQELEAKIREPWDLIVIVQPNNPTGALAPRDVLVDVLRLAHPTTRIWVDEAYIHFAGAESLVSHAVASGHRIFVSRSFSKSLALSGLRAACLIGPASEIAHLKRRTPPWIVGFPGQVAAIRALADAPYYEGRYAETRTLRRELATRLRDLSLDVHEGETASVLVHLGDHEPPAARVRDAVARVGVFLRDASDFGPSMGSSTLRVSVKDRASNERIVAALASALRPVQR